MGCSQVSARAVVSAEARLGRGMLPRLCGCCQHLVPHDLLDSEPQILADCWPEAVLSSQKPHSDPSLLGLPNTATDFIKDGHYNLKPPIPLPLHIVLVKSQSHVLPTLRGVNTRMWVHRNPLESVHHIFGNLSPIEENEILGHWFK